MAQCKVNAMSLARMVRLLQEEPRTAQELADETGLHYVTVARYMREFHKAKAAHIAAYEPDARGRDQVKVYALGRKTDAKPRKKSHAERQRLCRERKKAREMIHMMGGGNVAA